MQDAFGLEIPETLEEACDPARAALLVSRGGLQDPNALPVCGSSSCATCRSPRALPAFSSCAKRWPGSG